MTQTRGGSQHLGPPSPLIIRLGRWEWHGMTPQEEGGGETLPLNTSPTDRCRWPFLNLIIVVPTQGEMAWDFLWHPLLYLFPPRLPTAVSVSLLQAHSFVYRRIRLNLFIYLSGGCSGCPLLKMAILTDWSPLSLLSISHQIQSLCVFQWFINLQCLLR